MLISIIIPVYNEEKTIKEILEKINKIKKFKKQIIIVNDASNDNSVNIIKKKCDGLYNKFINLEKNRGKGYACREGIKFAEGDVILIQDADLEYDPNDYEIILEPIFNKQANVVYGSRFLRNSKRVIKFSFDSVIRLCANYFLTYLSNLMNKQNLTDAHTCYKAITRNVIDQIELIEDGFEFCPEITAKISKLNEKIYEVPINYYGRTHEEGKKIKFIDGFRAIKAILKYN